jgi:hypothetical protein
LWGGSIVADPVRQIFLPGGEVQVSMTQ